MDMKRCNKCKIDKPSVEFNKRKASKDGLNPRCKTCDAETSRIHYEADKYKHSISMKLWRKSTSAIYEIFSDDLSLYVGQSEQLNGRISQHKTWMKNPSIAPKSAEYLYLLLNNHSNVDIRIIEECSREVLIEREQHYIDTIKPLYNKKKSG